MRIVLGLGLILSAVATVVACGGEEERAPTIGTNSGKGGSGARGGSNPGDGGQDAEGGEGGAPPVERDPLDPIVVIVSPEELAHPNDGEVITGTEVEVLCTATQSPLMGSEPVDPSSVLIEILNAADEVVQGLPGTPTDNDDEYSATLQLGALSGGPLSLRCSASDIANPPHDHSATIGSFFDHGPEIIVTQPAIDSAHALLGAVAFEFEVLPAPLADGDDGADVDDVTLEVAGLPIDISEDDPGLFFGSVDFNNPALFPNAPSGPVPVIIRASNSREPTPVERVMSYNIVIDGEGPVITISSHEYGDVIGGKVLLAFTVVDALTGVNPDSVRVELGTVEFAYDPASPDWTKNGDAFTFSFDSRTLVGSVQTLVNITAEDGAGNASPGASLPLFFDQFPPIVDLDPGNVRERKASGQDTFCSESFDPLGTLMPNDTTVVYNIIPAIRALVWDETNTTPTLPWGHMSGTDTESVYVYIQPDVGTPLLVDTDDDPNNFCDNVDEALDLNFIHLQALPDQGSSWNNDEMLALPIPSGCTMQALPNPPNNLCASQTSDLRRVIGHETPLDDESVIYVQASESVECTGGIWAIDVLVQQEGWLCFAAVATDRVGNRGVSPPLRLCYDNPDTIAEPACATAPETAPDCTAACTPPTGFEAQIIDVP